MNRRVILILRLLYAVFLIGTGIMTIGLHFNPPEWHQSPAGEFLIAAGKTGYLLGWVGVFKTITGLFMLLPKTEKLAYLMALPYSINIFLWVTLVAHEWLHIGIPNFLVSIILVATHWDHYSPIFSNKVREVG